MANNRNTRRRAVRQRMSEAEYAAALRDGETGTSEVLLTEHDEYDGPTELSADIAIRARQVSDTGPTDAAEDFILRQVFGLKVSGMPEDQIAKRLNVSVYRVRRLLTEINKRKADEWRNCDPFHFIGRAMLRYDIAMEEGLQMAMLSTTTGTDGLPRVDWKKKKAGLEIMMKAQRDAIKLAQLGGMFEDTPLRPKLDHNEEDASKANALKQAAMKFLEGSYEHKNSVPADAKIVEWDDD